MHTLTRLSESERRRLIDDFLDAVFAGPDADPAYAGIIRSMTPELADDPEPEQVRAWVELVMLSQDADFRASMRRIAEQYAADRRQGDNTLGRDAAELVRDHVGPGLMASTDPASPRADRVVAAVVEKYAHLLGRLDSIDLRRRLLVRLETANDPRRERYLQLLSVINEWSAVESIAPPLDWFIQALRVRVPA